MKFWKDNKTDQQYEIHQTEITAEFVESQEYKNWLEGYPLHRCLSEFLEKLGSYEYSEFEELKDYVIKYHKDIIKRNMIIDHLNHYLFKN